MASREEVLAYTSLEIGSIPPLGNVLGLKTYFDEKIKEKDFVAFNAGSHTTSIKMTGLDLIKIVQPTFGSYAI
jgi:prolyl-tRNA editing enzyme YbaK/EbsC (Cys-tRNA(Pro) deacylase)